MVTETFVGINVSKASLDVHIDAEKKSLHVAYEAGLARIVSELRQAAPKVSGEDGSGRCAGAGVLCALHPPRGASAQGR